MRLHEAAPKLIIQEQVGDKVKVSSYWPVPELTRAAFALGRLQRHSDMSSLVVSEGSKVIVPFCSLALQFCSFLWCVSDSLSCFALRSNGFHSRVDASSLVMASLVHSCGWVQSLLQSSLHGWQLQKFIGLWSFSLSLILAEVLIRSAIVLVLCLVMRHLAALLFIGLLAAPICNHAGILYDISSDRHSAARSTLCFLPTSSILLVSLLILLAFGPLVGIFQVCKKVLSLVCAFWPLGAVVSRMMSVIFTHVGRIGERFR